MSLLWLLLLGLNAYFFIRSLKQKEYVWASFNGVILGYMLFTLVMGR